jgi:OmpA-OmpF porin, OOP family
MKTFLNGLVCLALSTGTAFAPLAVQAEGGYAGASFGKTSVDLECDLDITCAADDSDTGFKVYGGYQFTPNLAVEFGYVDLGEVTASGTDSFLGTTSVLIEASGFTLAAVGTIPLGDRFGLLGKAGFFRWDVDASATSSVFGSASDNETGTDLFLGFGGFMNLGKNLSLRVEWERFMDVGDEDTTGSTDVDLLSAGIVFRFR